MNLVCIKCGKGFSVSFEQFGTRGKCPNCHATIMVPRFRTTPAGGGQVLQPPGKWLDVSFSGLIAIGSHVLIFLMLAMIPWQPPRSGMMGTGDDVQIGVMPGQKLLQNNLDDFRLDTANPLTNRAELDALSLDAFSPRSMSETLTELASGSANAGGQLQGVTLDPAIAISDGEAGGGQEAFSDMVSRLQKDGLDIAIIFDSTGSMGGEITQVKEQIQRIGRVLFSLIPKTRICICTYRDQGAEYVVKGRPLSSDLGEVVGFLSEIESGGGGDEPEAVEEGMKWVIENNEFRNGARRVILIFGDQPPHVDDQLTCLKMASDFRRAGGVISTITCRNSKPLDAFVEIAQLGGGEAFLTTDQRQIMSRLIVLVFGSQHREKVLELFKLLDR